MATQLIAIGTGAANSSDITVVAGTPVAVALKSAETPYGGGGGGTISIQMKDDAGAYFVVDTLSGSKPACVLHAPGVYRLARSASSAACGAFSG